MYLFIVRAEVVRGFEARMGPKIFTDQSEGEGMTNTVEKQFTQKEIDDLREEVRQLRLKVENAEKQNLLNLEWLALAQEKEQLEERLIMLTH